MSDVAYGAQEWVDAVGEAELHSMCPVDTKERGTGLSYWIATVAIEVDEIGKASEVIKSAALALKCTGERKFTGDRLLTVLRSYLCDYPAGGTLESVITVESSTTGTRHAFDRRAW